MPYSPAVKDRRAEYIFAGGQARSQGIDKIGASAAKAVQQNMASRDEIDEMRAGLEYLETSGTAPMDPELWEKFENGGKAVKRGIFTQHIAQTNITQRQDFLTQQYNNQQTAADAAQLRSQANYDYSNKSRAGFARAEGETAAKNAMMGFDYRAQALYQNGDIDDRTLQIIRSSPDPATAESLIEQAEANAEAQSAATAAGVTLQNIPGIGVVGFDQSGNMINRQDLLNQKDKSGKPIVPDQLKPTYIPKDKEPATLKTGEVSMNLDGTGMPAGVTAEQFDSIGGANVQAGPVSNAAARSIGNGGKWKGTAQPGGVPAPPHMNTADAALFPAAAPAAKDFTQLSALELQAIEGSGIPGYDGLPPANMSDTDYQSVPVAPFAQPAGPAGNSGIPGYDSLPPASTAPAAGPAPTANAWESFSGATAAPPQDLNDIGALLDARKATQQGDFNDIAAKLDARKAAAGGYPAQNPYDQQPAPQAAPQAAPRSILPPAAPQSILPPKTLKATPIPHAITVTHKNEDGRPMVDSRQFHANVTGQLESSPLIGFVPEDGEEYGIKEGTKEEWARFFTGLADLESSMVADDYGDMVNRPDIPGGSHGLFSLSVEDPWNHRDVTGATEKEIASQLLDNPDYNTRLALTIAAKLIMRDKVIKGKKGNKYLGAASYFGESLRRNNPTAHFSTMGLLPLKPSNSVAPPAEPTTAPAPTPAAPNIDAASPSRFFRRAK